MTRLYCLSLFLGLFAVGLVGCGGQESSVAGKVTLDGSPLTLSPGSSGTVTFKSTSGGGMAQGQLDSSGNYSLNTGSDAGLKAGAYKVTVVATEMPPADPNNRSFVPIPKPLTPAKYGNPDTSGLTADVKPGKNDQNFDLKTK